MPSDNDRAIQALTSSLSGVVTSLLQLQRAVIDIAATLPEERRASAMTSINASLDELSKAVKQMGDQGG